jgi:hypothetical protein
MTVLNRTTMPNYDRGKNPKSQENLTYHEGRPTVWDEPTKAHGISVTDIAWNGLKQLSKDRGYRSISDLIEFIGRSYIEIPEKKDLDTPI